MFLYILLGLFDPAHLVAVMIIDVMTAAEHASEVHLQLAGGG
jgi:hypothetical protein